MSMDKEKSMDTLDALYDFLGDSEGQSIEEIKEELRNEGLDVEAILSRLKMKQREIAMAAKRSALNIAREKREELQHKINDFTGKFANWTREQVLERIKELSMLGRPMAGAFRELESMGDEDIINILEDLEMAVQSKKFQEGSDEE